MKDQGPSTLRQAPHVRPETSFTRPTPSRHVLKFPIFEYAVQNVRESESEEGSQVFLPQGTHPSDRRKATGRAASIRLVFDCPTRIEPIYETFVGLEWDKDTQDVRRAGHKPFCGDRSHHRAYPHASLHDRQIQRLVLRRLEYKREKMTGTAAVTPPSWMP